jgi:DNA polymerase-1
MKPQSCEHCPYFNKPFVPAEGRPDSPIIIIGEAPGAQEERTGRPFVGGAGQLLEKQMASVGIFRDQVYITNTIKCRPDGNDISSAQAQRAIQCCNTILQDELKHAKARVVVPLGNTALRALGISYPISKARGVVFPTTYGKVIPTWHPAYTMRQFQEYITGVYDWQKIKRHLDNPTIVYPREIFSLNPNLASLEAFVNDVVAKADAGILTEVGIDLETFETDHILLNPIKLVGIGINEGEAFVVPFITQAGNYYWQSDVEAAQALMQIARILEHPKLTKMFHNALFDVPVLMNHGIPVCGPIYDTMLAQFCVYNESQLSLAYLASIRTDYPPWKLLIGYTELEYRTYNARDCVVLHMLKPSLDEDLRSNGVEYVFRNLMNVIVPTSQMMLNGIHIDKTLQESVKETFSEKLALMTHELVLMSGRPDFNPRSSRQLQQVLFKDMKFKSSVHTATGELATGKDVINRLAVRYPDNEFLKLLLEYRSFEKLFSTYSDPFVFEDGRVRTQFKLTLDTGRYGSSNPNLQNLPADRGDSNGFIKRMYAAPLGKIIVSADFSQAELITIALIAQDEEWLDCFAREDDIHRLNGIALTGEYNEKYRTFYKNFIFGFNYGSEGSEIEKVAPKDLIAVLSIPQMIANFQAKHPRLYEYREDVYRQVRETKRVRNLFGRTRFFVGEVTKAQLRSAINYPIQSTVADIMHEKFGALSRELDFTEHKPILQLHDALYFEVAEKNVDMVGRVLKEVMEEVTHTPAGVDISLRVKLEAGSNLKDMEELVA